MTNIALLGFFGVGKSHVSRLLTNRIPGFQAVNTDDRLRDRFGEEHLEDIVRKHGAERYLQEEAGIIQELSGRKNLIISTGGTLCLLPASARLIRKFAIPFVLVALPETIIGRLRTHGQRPFLEETTRDSIIEQWRDWRGRYSRLGFRVLSEDGSYAAHRILQISMSRLRRVDLEFDGAVRFHRGQRISFGISDEVWNTVKSILPTRPNTHRFGGGRPRICDRRCFEGIIFVLKTGCTWHDLKMVGICPSSTAHDRFTEWRRLGLFTRIAATPVAEAPEFVGVDWGSELQV